MTIGGFRPAQPSDDIFLGNVRDDAQADAEAADKNGDNVISREEAYVASANKQPNGTTLPRFEDFKPDIPKEHDLPTLAREEAGYPVDGRYLLGRSEHLGDFHVDGMGFGNARFTRMPSGPYASTTSIMMPTRADFDAA